MGNSYFTPVRCRIKTAQNGFVLVHDVARNFLEQIYPFERFQKDENGDSMVIKRFAQKLQKRDLIRLTDTLMALDLNSQMDWTATYLFIKRQ